MVAEAIERRGHTVRMLDLMFAKDPVGALRSALREGHPDVIGLSVRNIDNNDMQEPAFFIKDLLPLIDLVRESSESPIVLGGSAMGVMPEQILQYTGASYGVLGDGEIVFPGLLEALSNGGSVERLPGVVWRDRSRIRMNREPSGPNSDSCWIPDLPRWIDLRAYSSTMATVPIQSKLGCHFKCIYCTYRRIEGSGYRLFRPESVVDAVKRVESMGLRDLEFVDSVFNSPYDHTMAVLEALARVRHKTRLQSLELNPLGLDDDLVRAMERAGFVGIGITVESASGKVLERLGKGFGETEVHKAAEVVRRHELPCLWIFLLGGPGETKQTVMQTLRFVKEHIRPKDAVFFNTGIRIYPGTGIEAIARREGLLTLRAEEMLSPVFYLSPEIELEWVAGQVRSLMDAHPNVMGSDPIELPLVTTIHRLAYRLGLKPPLWRHTRLIRRFLKITGIHP